MAQPVDPVELGTEGDERVVEVGHGEPLVAPAPQVLDEGVEVGAVVREARGERRDALRDRVDELGRALVRAGDRAVLGLERLELGDRGLEREPGGVLGELGRTVGEPRGRRGGARGPHDRVTCDDARERLGVREDVDPEHREATVLRVVLDERSDDGTWRPGRSCDAQRGAHRVPGRGSRARSARASPPTRGGPAA